MREKIIVVEDEFYINDILTTALEEEKFQVLSLFNGESLKENLMDFAPDIILLDVNLPDINGFELCKYINKELSIPIILITARNDVVDKVLGLELGAHDYITKPFHIKEVLARIRAALRSRAIYSSTLTNDLSNQPVAISPVLKVDFDSRIILKNNEEIKNQLEYLMKEKENALLLQKSKNNFFNNVTHELKTPLTTISGYSQLLLSPKVEDKNFRDRAINGIFQESERMHSLIVELINISKNLNNPQKELIPIELSTFISRILDNLKIKWKNKAYSLNLDMEDTLILSDTENITSLLTNILDNAIKYSLDNGVIAINLKTQNNLVYLTVENSYDSSTSFIKDKLFEPFVKGTNSTEDSNGLGLYICKEIVNSLNGEIIIQLTKETFKLIITFPSFCNISETI